MLTITFDSASFLRQTAAAQRELVQRQPDLLQMVGMQILSLAQQNYIDKARGGGGADGKPWRPLQAATILARLRKRSHISGTKKKQATVLKSSKGTTALLQSLRKQGAIEITHSTGKGGRARKGSRNAVRKGDTIRIVNGRQMINSINAGRTSKNTKKISAVGAFEIGVDTGLQRASASPGFRGPDGKGGNAFDIGPGQVTVGYNRSYSPFFDRARPLIPDPIPAAWKQRVGQIARTWADGIIKRNLGGGK